MGDHLDNLAALAGDGDRKALEQMIRILYADMMRFASRMTHRSDAEDAVQEAAIRIARGIRHFRRVSSVRTWALSITANCVRDHQRASQRRGRREAGAADRGAIAELDRSDGDPRRRWLRDQLAASPEPIRATAVLVLELGLSQAEAAEVMGVAPGTIAWRMSELRRLLASAMAREAAV